MKLLSMQRMMETPHLVQKTYTVKQGDTLSSIAGDRDGVTVNSIAYNNNIDNPNNIMVGQKLKNKKECI